MKSYFDPEEEIEEALTSLPEAVCPHCGANGEFVGHDTIWEIGGADNLLRLNAEERCRVGHWQR